MIQVGFQWADVGSFETGLEMYETLAGELLQVKAD